MDKKEIYEHLAKIYLDASSKSTDKKRKNRLAIYRFLKQPLIISSLAVVFAFSVFASINIASNRRHEIALFLQDDATKINFNFDPAKKETYKISLKKLNLKKFSKIGFALMKTEFNDKISLRIEFVNSFNEKSEIYIKQVPSRWQDYKFALSDFKKISNWDSMRSLTFTVEEWNARAKKGELYVDNIRLIK